MNELHERADELHILRNQEAPMQAERKSCVSAAPAKRAVVHAFNPARLYSAQSSR